MTWNSWTSPGCPWLHTILFFIASSEHIWVTVYRHIEASHWALCLHHTPADAQSVDSRIFRCSDVAAPWCVLSWSSWLALCEYFAPFYKLAPVIGHKEWTMSKATKAFTLGYKAWTHQGPPGFTLTWTSFCSLAWKLSSTWSKAIMILIIDWLYEHFHSTMAAAPVVGWISIWGHRKYSWFWACWTWKFVLWDICSAVSQLQLMQMALRLIACDADLTRRVTRDKGKKLRQLWVRMVLAWFGEGKRKWTHNWVTLGWALISNSRPVSDSLALSQCYADRRLAPSLPTLRLFAIYVFIA